jgi:hypothetical protein
MNPPRFLLLILLLAPLAAFAQLQLSGPLIAGTPATLHAGGSGNTTLYLFGPASAARRNVLRGDIPLSGDELHAAGRYIVIIDGQRAAFFVSPAETARIAFLAHPSRVPAAGKDAVIGTAFLFDRFQNLVLAPQPVAFQLGSDQRTVMARNGVASVQMDAGRRSGPAPFIASAGDLQTVRIVQQVAADPCSLRMSASSSPDGNILVETAPIEDCSGNAIPDGTIVTFASVDAAGRSTVDARVKHGLARAELPASNSATLSVAAGVALGNQIQWKGH